MSVKNHRIFVAGAVLGAALMLTGSAFAQGIPCTTSPKPYGGLMFDVSRDLYKGVVQPGITYFYICPNAANTGEVTRYTYRQPLHLELNNPTNCDELPLNMTLDGYYYSQTRMNNPFPPNATNVRIGWHYGSAQVKTTDAAGNVTVIGTARFEGTIATNTSRPPLPQGKTTAGCYECGHHTGEIVITFLNVTGSNTKLGTIKAFYQFDALYPAPAPATCDTTCDTNFAVDGGTLDGINFRVCQ